MCVTFISYFDKIKSCAKKEPESSGNEISTSRPTGLSNSPDCCSAPKTTTKGSSESMCVSENTSVLEWEIINLSKGLHRGGKQDPILAQLQIESESCWEKATL